MPHSVSKADKEVAKDLRDVGHSWESIGETFEVPGQKANDAVRHGDRAKKGTSLAILYFIGFTQRL